MDKPSPYRLASTELPRWASIFIAATFDLVKALRDQGVNAFPVQADVTNMTHLWAGEAVYHQEFLQIIYVSSRMAIDPGPPCRAT